MRYVHVFFAVILLYLSLGILKAEDTSDTWGVGVLPVIGYDDEESWVFGAASVFYYNPSPSDKDQELDELDLTGTYNLRGGYEVNTDITKNFNGNDRFIQLDTGYQHVINDDYGINSPSDRPDMITYTSTDIPFGICYGTRVYDHLYLKPAYDSKYHGIKDVEHDQVLSSGETTDSKTFVSGIGLGISYKTTNSGLYKRRGFVLSVGSKYYSPVLLSDYTFQTYGASYKHYFSLYKNTVLGIQLDYDGACKDVPLDYMPELGGSKLLRGFDSNRYIARNRIAGQTEFRFPLLWRFGGTVFAGAGEAENSFKDFGSRIKTAGGIGMRIAVKKEQNLNIRFDLAYNSDGELKKYIKIKEAF